MTLKDYLLDKKYFIIYYFTLMFFISLMFALLISKDGKLTEILYVNIIGLVLTVIYIVGGYLSKNELYKEIEDIIKSEKTNLLDISVNNITLEQKLFINLYKHIQHVNVMNLKIIDDERKDYQDFILSWVHDIKLPIATSKLILSNSYDNDCGYIIDRIEDEIMKIDNYVEQVLYYSRLDSFSNDYLIEEIEVSKLIRTVIKKYAKIFINKKIRVSVFENNEYINSDVKWLLYSVEQIISNSLKYTNENGFIDISFEEDNMKKTLIIKDSGIGINSQDINRVFDKGFTGNIGREYNKATGMGLYLSKKMIEKLGHGISVESIEGEYTIVTIDFYKVQIYSQF